MNRRKFIRSSGYGSAFILSGVAGSLLSSCMKKMQEPSSGPVNVIEGNFTIPLINSGTLPFTNPASLDLQWSNNSGFNASNISPCLGYHVGGFPAPTIRINSGSSITIPLQNNIGDYSNIHWHGLIVPENMDGHPKDVIAPGSSFDYSFTVNQRAGTYWYHPHVHGTTAKQTYFGLAGFFIVNDAEEQALNLPSGEFDVPIVIQDKRLFPDLAFDYSPNTDDIMNGYLGQYVYVNGVYAPQLRVKKQFYRIRVLNGSNARIYNLALSNGGNFTLIGSDAGLLANSQSITSLLLGPGERADLLIDLSFLNLLENVDLISKTFNGGDAQGQQEFKILRFMQTDATTGSFTVPGALSAITMIPELSAVRSRTFSLVPAGGHVHGGMMGSGHKINDKVFDMERIDENVNSGETEIWVFDNTDGTEPHPMHIHGVQFQVLDRTGGRGYLIQPETGWKDTVMLMPGEKVRVIMTFPNNPGTFVFHCHNLEHADDGMMLQFKIS